MGLIQSLDIHPSRHAQRWQLNCLYYWYRKNRKEPMAGRDQDSGRVSVHREVHRPSAIIKTGVSLYFARGEAVLLHVRAEAQHRVCERDESTMRASMTVHIEPFQTRTARSGT